MRRITKKRIPVLDGRGGALPPINAPATHSTVNEKSKELANPIDLVQKAYTQDGDEKKEETMTIGDPTSEDATTLDKTSKSSKAN